MRLEHWLPLLARNGFRVHPSRLPWALLTTASAASSSMLYQMQQLVYGRRINATEPVAPPIFILGHWRTGTTFLQEMLSHDPRLTSPSNYQVYSANHFLLTEDLAVKYLNFLLPSKRPMDNVTLKWESPQEDEWARITMGLPSPYLRVAFARQPPPFAEYLNLDGVNPTAIEAWKAGFMKFLRMVTLKTGKRLVFKSPHHTGRLKVLHEMFPDAKFIHVTRDPFTFFPSTLRMYRSFDHTQSLQKPAENDGLEDYVLDSGRRMYDSYHSYRGQVPEDQILDVRYDDLVKNPVSTMRDIYARLSLGDIEPALGGFEKYLAPRKNYVTNRHQLPDYWQARIRSEWGQYFESFGYNSDDEG